MTSAHQRHQTHQGHQRHAGALLMCGENHLADPELQQLCREILASQQREIDQMKAKLE